MGTLKETVAVHVRESAEGRTHAELQGLLRVRVHNTLLELVRQGAIGRRRFGRVHLYVSANGEQGDAQLERRVQVASVLEEALREPSQQEVVEILVETLQAAPELPHPQAVARRLVARGVRLEPRHVEQVFAAHGLVAGKKTVPPIWPPSRR